MTRDQFEALAQAYGGDMARWPNEEWDAAALFAADEPQTAGRILAEAGRLDRLLDGWAPMEVSHRLREAVVASAPPPRRARRLGGWFWGAGAGAGLAAACAAGLMVGVMLAERVAPVQSDETVSAALGGYEDLSGLIGGEEA